MKILILNRSKLSTTPYLDWLGPEHSGVLITASDAISKDEQAAQEELAGYLEVIRVEGFHANPAVESAAWELHAQHGFEAIIAMSEFDLLRAARLRAALGIPGQTLASAKAYRDKAVMKELLAAAGIPMAPYAPIPDATTLHTFIAEHGYPVVVKPRTGAGSMGVEVLHDSAELAAYLELNPCLGGDDDAALLAEKFIAHDLFHVDGLVIDGVLVFSWPSACGSCLSYRDGDALVSAMLDAQDPLFEPLRQLTLEAMGALPTPATTTFHAEIFRTPEGELLLNEIASRIGGGKIYETCRLALDVDMARDYVRAVGGSFPVPDPVRRADRLAGFAIFPGQAGTLTHAPQSCTVDGVNQYRLNVEIGTVLGQAENSSARIASVVVEGATRSEVEDVLERASRWFAEATVVEPRTEEGV